MSEEVVLYAADGKVGVVTLNRPQKLNAMTMEMRLAIEAQLLRADADETTSVIVLRGEGRSFCVGFDVGGGNHPRPWRHDAIKYRERLAVSMRCLMTPWTLKKPVIAAVQGHALGGGCELAMFCDLTIAADDALFGEPEILFSQVGPAVLMPFIVGHKRAREMWMLCRRYTAAQMLDWGLVNAVVPADQLDAEVRKWCDELLALSPTALKTVKSSFKDHMLPYIGKNVSDVVMEVAPGFFETGEQEEGGRAFMEKRKPDFSRFR